MEVEHLQRRYQHLHNESSNQLEQTIRNNQCSKESDVNKGKKVIESNFQNPELMVVSATFLLVCFLSPKERTCETWKNDFYFTSKSLSVLEKIKF